MYSEFFCEMRSSYCTYHNSSRALKTHELTITIFAKFFLSPYISLREYAAILTVLPTRVCHLVPDFWQCINFYNWKPQCVFRSLFAIV